MVKQFQNKLDVSVKQVAIVAGQFNEFVTKRLYTACVETLLTHGIADDHIHVAWVPGAFEIPLAAKLLAEQQHIDAVICLGCVIKGETYHFDSIVQESTRGIGEVALLTGKPIVYEVLAVDHIDLANARSQSDGDNKGIDAADAAITMMALIDQLK